MKKIKPRVIYEKTDKLTNSIENRISGDILQTEFHTIRKADLKQIKTNDWVFDWYNEIKNTKKIVYKLTIKHNTDIIQGLLSLSVEKGFVFIHLVENATFNRGKNKIYLGVLGNMFAYACKLSKDKGLDGYVVFIAKTALREHYERSLGAKSINNQKMYIYQTSADKLITQYFNS